MATPTPVHTPTHLPAAAAAPEHVVCSYSLWLRPGDASAHAQALVLTAVARLFGCRVQLLEERSLATVFGPAGEVRRSVSAFRRAAAECSRRLSSAPHLDMAASQGASEAYRQSFTVAFADAVAASGPPGCLAGAACPAEASARMPPAARRVKLAMTNTWGAVDGAAAGTTVARSWAKRGAHRSVRALGGGEKCQAA